MKETYKTLRVQVDIDYDGDVYVNNGKGRFSYVGSLIGEKDVVVTETIKEMQEIREKAVAGSVKEEREKLKKFWYYAGKWHKAECDFILNDRGVCNCENIRLS